MINLRCISELHTCTSLVVYHQNCVRRVRQSNSEAAHVKWRSFCCARRSRVPVFCPTQCWRRTKEAFLDGVSPPQHSWYKLIQMDLDRKLSDAEYERHAARYEYLRPHSKEALYYRQLFERYFHEEHSEVVPHSWLPRSAAARQRGQSGALSARTRHL